MNENCRKRNLFLDIPNNLFLERIGLVFCVLYFATIPIENLLGTSIGSIHKYLGIIIICISGISLLTNSAFFISPFIKPLGIFVAISTASFAWLIDGAQTDYITTVFFLIIFTFFASQINFSIKSYKIICFSICLFCFFISLLLLFGSRFSHASMYDGGRLTLVFGKADIDQNNLSISLCISVVICLDSILSKKKSLPIRLFYLLMMIVIAIAILFTGSRGGLIGIFLAIVTYFFSIMNKENFSKYILAFVVGMVFTIVLANVFLPASILQRFTLEDVIDSGGTGRIDIWKQSISAFFSQKNIFRIGFGNGFGSFGTFMSNNCHMYVAAHNDFVQLLIELGVIGVLTYLLITIYIFVKLIKNKDPLSLALFVLIIVGSLSMELVIKKMYWAVVFLIVLYDKNLKRSQL